MAAYDAFNEGHFTDYLGLSGLIKNFVIEEPDEFSHGAFEVKPERLDCPSWPAISHAPIVPCRSHDKTRARSTGEVSSDSSEDESEVAHTAGLKPFELATIMSMSKVYNDSQGQRSRKIIRCCVFCKNNGEIPEVYNSHTCKSVDGTKTTCPILRAYTCPVCGANKDDAHTIKYCPYNVYVSQSPAVSDFVASSRMTWK